MRQVRIYPYPIWWSKSLPNSIWIWLNGSEFFYHIRLIGPDSNRVWVKIWSINMITLFSRVQASNCVNTLIDVYLTLITRATCTLQLLLSQLIKIYFLSQLINSDRSWVFGSVRIGSVRSVDFRIALNSPICMYIYIILYNYV